MSEKKQRVRKLQEKVVKYFCERPANFPVGRPYNCCESVLLALVEHLVRFLRETNVPTLLLKPRLELR